MIDTQTTHRLVDGEYAQRRAECTQAARLLDRPTLRDVPREMMDGAAWAAMPSVLQRRARHVVTENERVLELVERLRHGGPASVGGLMTASHASLRDDFQVSVAQLDAAVDAALGAGAIGARMTGGGFGGCAIALVEERGCDEVTTSVRSAFRTRAFKPPRIFRPLPAQGAARIA